MNAHFSNFSRQDKKLIGLTAAALFSTQMAVKYLNLLSKGTYDDPTDQLLILLMPLALAVSTTVSLYALADMQPRPTAPSRQQPS